MRKILATLTAIVLTIGTALAQEQTFVSFLKTYESTPGCTYLTMQGPALKAIAKQLNAVASFEFLIGHEKTTMHLLTMNRSQMDYAKWEEVYTGAIKYISDGGYRGAGSKNSSNYFIRRDSRTVYALFAISKTALYLFETSVPYSEMMAAGGSGPKADNKQVGEEDVPFQLVEEKPKFNSGGPEEFNKWVNERLVYPEIAKQNGISGIVHVRFTVGDDGKVKNVKVVKGVDPALDAEAVRVVQSSPRWTPGKQNGKPVNVTYVFSVSFGFTK